MISKGLVSTRWGVVHTKQLWSSANCYYLGDWTMFHHHFFPCSRNGVHWQYSKHYGDYRDVSCKGIANPQYVAFCGHSNFFWVIFHWSMIRQLGGGFKRFLEFSARKLGKMNPFWRANVSNGWEKTANYLDVPGCYSIITPLIYPISKLSRL